MRNQDEKMPVSGCTLAGGCTATSMSVHARACCCAPCTVRRTARLWNASCAQPLLEFSHLEKQVGLILTATQRARARPTTMDSGARGSCSVRAQPLQRRRLIRTAMPTSMHACACR